MCGQTITEQMQYAIECGMAAALGQRIAQGFMEEIEKSGAPTLRDRFALAAVPALIARGRYDGEPFTLLRAAYALADAAMKVRGETAP